MTRESLQAKIEKAEEKDVRTGKTYDAACEELKKRSHFLNQMQR